jgi:hypothetical protein
LYAINPVFSKSVPILKQMHRRSTIISDYS